MIAVIGTVIVVLHVKNKQRIAEVWESMARDMKLTYLNTGLPTLRGLFMGRSVYVKVYKDSSGNSASRVNTRFEINYTKSLKVDFQLARQGLFQGAIGLFGGKDIVTGDRSFDDRVVLQGRDESRVLDFFQSNLVRAACENLIGNHQYIDVEVTNKKIGVAVSGKVMSPYRIKEVLNHLTVFADAIEAEHQKKIGGTPKEEVAEVAPPPLPVREKKPSVPEEWHEPEIKEFQPAPLLSTELAAEVMVEGAPEPDEPETVEEVIETPEPEDVENEPEKPENEEPAKAKKKKELTVAKVTDQLFEEKVGRYEAGKRFQKKFSGKKVKWQGTLSAIEPGSRDRAFGQNTGWIAVVNLKDGSTPLKIRYRIGDETRDLLQSKTGETIAVKGKLVKFDSFSNTIYVDSGESGHTAQPEVASRYTPYSERMKSDSPALQSTYQPKYRK